MIKVVTDSTADIPPDRIGALGITVIPSYVVFGVESYRDDVELTKEQFYAKLEESRELPRTAAPPPAIYKQTYSRLAEETDEIVSIHLASKFSMLYNAAVAAAGEISGVRIEVIDSGQVSMGYGWMAIAAAEAARGGEPLEQIVSLVESMKLRAHLFAVLDTLDFVYRGGRVSWVQAMVGTLLKIKPLIDVRLSEVVLLERARTLERSLGRLLARIQSLGPLERAIVLHANAPDRAERVADWLQEAIPDWDRLVGQAGVTVASHAGPGAVGIACVAAE